jgi:uncharacterized cupredoxin-like copper-binding protein
MTHLRLFLLLASAVAATTGASGQAPDWVHAARVDVTLSNFSYSPSAIHLRAGQPVVLHLVNSASGGHDFTAERFFAAASVRPQDRGSISQGSVQLSAHQSRDIMLVPKAGRYPLKCSHTFHKMFGMTGTILVD